MKAFLNPQALDRIKKLEELAKQKEDEAEKAETISNLKKRIHAADQRIKATKSPGIISGFKLTKRNMIIIGIILVVIFILMKQC